MYIETKNLVKTFSGRNVVDGVSLRVDKGQVVGLLGPNGAGKTTSFYMIVGIERGINLSFHVCRGQYSCHATDYGKKI